MISDFYTAKNRSDISMKFTWFAASSHIGKLKALLIIFNNSFANFSAFKWEIVNYFVFFTVFFLGTYLFEVESGKYYNINFCTLWNQLLKCITMALSETRRLQADFSNSITKVKVEILHKKSNTKSYNKTVIDFSFGWQKDLSTLKKDIHLGGLSEYHFFGLINPHVSLNEVGPWENVSYAICKQQRHRSACTSAQSDQRFCCLLLR